LNTESAFASLMFITNRPPIIMVQGNGSWLTDRDGKRYLDFIQGWAVNCLGHSPRVAADAIARQAYRLIIPSPALYNDQAIKLARKWGGVHRHGAFEIVTMINGFHGRTLATMSEGKMPWPLTREELTASYDSGLKKESFEDYIDNEDSPIRRFRAVYRRET
jgi:acetylornithine/N-succinyldiaminopimelate aminotransferase